MTQQLRVHTALAENQVRFPGSMGDSALKRCDVSDDPHRQLDSYAHIHTQTHTYN